MSCCGNNSEAVGINRDAEERTRLWNICRACEFRVNAFGGDWCGVPWIVDPKAIAKAFVRLVSSVAGVMAVPESVDQVKACGCSIRMKLQFVGTSCPKGMW